MKKLKFNHNKEMPLHKLPFVGGKSKTGFGLSFWNVPATGGYSGGNDTGSALACIYLNHIVNNGANSFVLTAIISEMAEITDESTKGQMVGFFSVIENVIGKLIKDSGVRFSKSDEELLLKANAGLKFQGIKHENM